MKKRKTKQIKKHQKLSIVQKICLSVIGVCFVLVIVFLIVSLVNTPEKQVKGLISRLSSEYYEDYMYASFSESTSFKEDPANILKNYEESGFSPITLRQLLLYGNKKNAEHTNLLRKYCNENQTSARFYPEAPYGKTNYRIIYTYSCEF